MIYSSGGGFGLPPFCISGQNTHIYVSTQFRPKGHMAGSAAKPSRDGFRIIRESIPARVQPKATVAVIDAPDRSNRCSANDDTCKAYRVKGTDLCAGHSRKVTKGDEGEAGRTAVGGTATD